MHRCPPLAGAMLAAALLAASLPATASADVGLGPATGFEAAFTTPRPGAASGLELRVTGVPPAPGTAQSPPSARS
jgi:hypothetical protein